MAPSIIEKYEQILAADPRSRIFVELARALVERGETDRAVEVCRRGLEHHPGSILGRVTWGRALLTAGDLPGAMDQFEIAIAIEPANPYAYNHVGQALLAKGLHKEALPVLARAAELQPADAKVRGWLEEAKRRARGEPATAQEPGGAPEPPARISLEDEPTGEVTAPFQLPAPSRGRAANRPATGSHPAVTPVRPSPVVARGARSEAASTPAAFPEPVGAGEAGEASAAAGAEPPGVARMTPPPIAGRLTPPPVAGRMTPPPIAGRMTPPPGGRPVLYDIPEGGTRDVIGPSLASRLNIPAARAPAAPAAPTPDAGEAERAAAQYERELRERLMKTAEPPPTFVQKHRRLVLGGVVALALAAASGAYLAVSARNAALRAAGASAHGRAGLARDTLASLREAHRLLREASKRSADPEIASLDAQVSAILAVEHGDEDARRAARELLASGSAGDGAIAARWLLAETPAERAGAEAGVLSARPGQTALLQALAGRILAEKGEVENGRSRLELAARSSPPLLRALSDLGDLALAGGDPEGALGLYAAALGAQKTHPRSVVGAAEARLALGRDLAVSRAELDAVEADPGSAPPRDLRLRHELVRARVVAALGDPAAAATRLARFAETQNESTRLAAALAELHLQARSWERAEAVAARAVARTPADPELRVLLARARIGRGRFQEALAATEGADGRAIRIQRAIARYRLGQWSEARAELERTSRDGKVPAEAAVWLAFVDVAAGKPDRALSLLEKLIQGRTTPPLAHVALGTALEATGRRADAEAAYRAATEREPLAPEGHAALGRLLVAEGRPRDAVEPLERAVKLDPSDVAARRALAQARLAAGQASAARADLDVVLLTAPRDVTALRLLATAWLTENQPGEARVAAERAVTLAPRDPAALAVAARAAEATGDAGTARRLAVRALKAGVRGPDRDAVVRLAGSAGANGAAAPKPVTSGKATKATRASKPAKATKRK
jgi:tetratricopeptide (TPR) repeat protein